MCLNWGILMVVTLAGVTILSPVDPDLVIGNATSNTVPDLPNSFNLTSPSGTLYDNFTGQNFNGSSDPFDPTNFGIVDYFNWGLMSIQWIMSVISPYYIFSFLVLLGYPAVFILGLSSIIGISMILLFIYYISGKGA